MGNRYQAADPVGEQVLHGPWPGDHEKGDARRIGLSAVISAIPSTEPHIAGTLPCWLCRLALLKRPWVVLGQPGARSRCGRDSWAHVRVDPSAGGVMMSHRNLLANFEQLMSDYFADYGRLPPPDTTMVSWLPFYHDMGLIWVSSSPVLAGLRVFTSPISFLLLPARWLQMMAATECTTGGPNFAYRSAARTPSDDDMAGLDLSGRAFHPQRCRAGAACDVAAVHRAVRTLQPSRPGDLPVVRNGRSNGVRRDQRSGSTTSTSSISTRRN